MSKGYRYPEDEFDADPAQDAPIGVHRAPRTWWSRWWPFVAVLVLVPALTVGGVLWYSSRGGTLPGEGLGEQPAASAPATSEAAETPEETPAAPEETEPEAPAPEDTPEPTPDLTADVGVVNAANVSGLAAGAAEQLEDAGFTSVTTGNGTAGGRTASTVFYATPELAVTAQQVAATLGIADVVESADVAGDGVVVLLLRDFAS